MSRRLVLALTAIAIGLGTLLVPSAVSTAHAGISVPLPPPSLAPPPKAKGQVRPAMVLISVTER